MKKEELGKKYLPIGTVVMLKGGTKRIMIVGFYSAEKGTEEIYDYSGCLYPEGIISTDQVLLFNHTQIDEIYSVGYSDEEETAFKKELKKIAKSQKNKSEASEKTENKK